jgi:hypothetical protein
MVESQTWTISNTCPEQSIIKCKKLVCYSFENMQILTRTDHFLYISYKLVCNISHTNFHTNCFAYTDSLWATFGILECFKQLLQVFILQSW